MNECMKVFISSVITGYEQVRAAAVDAVTTLGHEVIRAEDFPASTFSPQVACLDGVRRADLVVVLLGRRYGAVQPSGRSATHEEFAEAQDLKEMLAFVEEVPDREPRQADFVLEVEKWKGGLLTKHFTTPDTLRRVLTRALSDVMLADARGTSDPEEVRARAMAKLPKEDRQYASAGHVLALSMAGGPRQVLLRPVQMEGKELEDALYELAILGPHAFFDRAEGTKREPAGEALVLKQPSSSLALHPDGSLVLRVRIRSESRMGALIEEDVAAGLEKGLGFINDVLTEIDPTERLRDILVAADLPGSGYTGWRTRAEDLRKPTSMSMGSLNRAAEPVTTGAVPRGAMRVRRSEMAEDLIVLLRKRFT